MRASTIWQTGRLRLTIVIVLASSILVPVTQRALAASARDSSVQISANSIKLEAAKRRVLYSGRVRLKHETLTIAGSKAIAESQNTSSGKVTVTGKPVTARFVDARGNTVRLTTRSLVYDQKVNSLVAVGDVVLQAIQGTLSGQEMRYDLANDLFSMKGNRNAPRISAILNIRESLAK